MSKQDQTSSFLLRFTQKIFEDDKGEADVQWRGKITHVQGNDQKNFSELKDAIAFIQEKLSTLTLSSIETDATTEEKEGLLEKSMDIWKKLIQIKNRIHHQLPRSMIGNISSSIDFIKLSVFRAQHFLINQ